MDTQNMLQKVAEFHRCFGAAISDTPSLPDESTSEGLALRKLRRKLIREEFNEFLAAEDDNDIVEIADACADLLYVILGTAVSYGIPLDVIFDEVHRSNMSKLDENGKPIYRADGKVLKSSSFTPPDIAGIIAFYQGGE